MVTLGEHGGSELVRTVRVHTGWPASALAVRTIAVLAGAALVWLGIDAALAPFVGDAHTDRLGHAVRAVLTTALVVPLVVFARRHLDARPWDGLALEPLRRGGWRHLASGAAFWAGAAAIATMLTVLLGWSAFTAGEARTSTLLLALYLPVLVLLLEALPEELLFRGYLYRNLADRMPRWAAVVVQAALFTVWAALLGAAGSVNRVILFFTFGVVLGALRVVTGSVWTPIGFHIAFQWVAQLLGAAERDGVLVVDGRAMFDLMALWFVPIVIGTVVLAIVGARRGLRWSTRDSEVVP